MKLRRLGIPLLLSLATACDPPSQAVSPPAVSTGPEDPEAPASAATSESSANDVSTKPAGPTVTPPSEDQVKRLAASSNAFGMDLYARVRSEPGNLVVSPMSLSTALAMTYGGARANTADEMRNVMHFDGDAEAILEASGRLAQSLEDPSRPITFRIANRLFGEATYEFEPQFLKQTKEAFGAPLESVDFRGAPEGMRQKINGWVEDKTEDRIQELIPPKGIDATTRLVLVNAIYFLGDWEEPFEKESTSPAAFYRTKTDSIDVDTMNNVAAFPYASQPGVSAVALPYEGGSMSMVFVLPDEKDGLPALEEKLSGAMLDDLIGAMSPERVWVQLPKFTIDPAQTMSLGSHLVEMGMKDAFDARKADFTGIANPPDPDDRLYIGKVFHKGFIRVDEKGTEAAAATAVVMPRAGSAPAQPKEFKADHPFLFFVRDNATGMILFMGRVADPSAS